jgi:hypothetical protein
MLVLERLEAGRDRTQSKESEQKFPYPGPVLQSTGVKDIWHSKGILVY